MCIKDVNRSIDVVKNVLVCNRERMKNFQAVKFHLARHNLHKGEEKK